MMSKESLESILNQKSKVIGNTSPLRNGSLKSLNFVKGLSRNSVVHAQSEEQLPYPLDSVRDIINEYKANSPVAKRTLEPKTS